MRGIFARLCLLWHCIEDVSDMEVSEKTARRGADFMRRYLLPHAIAFYAGVLDPSDDHERITKVAGFILAKKLTRVTSRDVQQGCFIMRGLKRQEIDGVFEQLEALGWLIRMPGLRWSDPPRWQVQFGSPPPLH